MLDRNNGRDASQPREKRKTKESAALETSPEKGEQDKLSSLEQFKERGYDSGFVYHEE